MTNATRFQICAIHATRIAQKTIKVVSRGKVRPIWTFILAAHFAERNRLAQQHLEKSKEKTTDAEPPSVFTYMNTTNHDPLSRYKRRAHISSFTCASIA